MSSKGLEILDAIKNKDWNPFRKYFHTLSAKDLAHMANIWDEWYPNQASFKQNLIENCLIKLMKTIKHPKIVELGCHQGHLARQLLLQFPIDSWIGYDINASALKRSVVEDDRYKTVALTEWFYHTKLPQFNLFVSSHTLEHLTLEMVEKTISHISKQAKGLILEIPIKEKGRNWNHYSGSHILPCGRSTIVRLLNSYEYKLIIGYDNANWVTAWTKN